MLQIKNRLLMLVYFNLSYTKHHNLYAGVLGHRYAIRLLDKPTENVDTAMTVRPEELLILALQIVPVVREPSGYGHHVLHFFYACICAHGALQDWAQGLCMEEGKEKGNKEDQLHTLLKKL